MRWLWQPAGDAESHYFSLSFFLCFQGSGKPAPFPHPFKDAKGVQTNPALVRGAGQSEVDVKGGEGGFGSTLRVPGFPLSIPWSSPAGAAPASHPRFSRTTCSAEGQFGHWARRLVGPQEVPTMTRFRDRANLQGVRRLGFFLRIFSRPTTCPARIRGGWMMPTCLRLFSTRNIG